MGFGYFICRCLRFCTAGDGKLGTLKLSCPGATGRFQQVRLVIEKPFGRDLESARELENVLLRHFNESQIYRIDHYLGKETVRILVFRFANSLFEPVGIAIM